MQFLMQHVLLLLAVSLTAYIFVLFFTPLRIHGGTSRRWWHIPGWLHCEEIELALSRHHPFLHDVCNGEPTHHLHLSYPLPQRAHGWCHSTIPVQSDGEARTGPVQTSV